MSRKQPGERRQKPRPPRYRRHSNGDEALRLADNQVERQHPSDLSRPNAPRTVCWRAAPGDSGPGPLRGVGGQRVGQPSVPAHHRSIAITPRWTAPVARALAVETGHADARSGRPITGIGADQCAKRVLARAVRQGGRANANPVCLGAMPQQPPAGLPRATGDRQSRARAGEGRGDRHPDRLLATSLAVPDVFVWPG